VFAFLDDRFPATNGKKLASFLFSCIVLHMAEATACRQTRSVELNLKTRFSTEGSASYREVLDAINK
jgi:hypothetical protein